MSTSRIYPVNLSGLSNKTLMVNQSGTGLTVSAPINTFRVSKSGGDFVTIHESISYLNTYDGGGSRLIIDAGTWYIQDTITVSTIYPVYIEGSGVNSTFISPTAGMTGKPLFVLNSVSDITNLTIDNIGLTSWGTQSSENAINVIDTNYHEITNFVINNSYDGVKVTNASNIFVYNFIMSDINNYCVNISSPTYSALDCETGTIYNSNGIHLNSSVDGIFDIDSIFFYPTNGSQVGIEYNPASYSYFDYPTIRNNKCGFIGTFSHGFDFTRSDGRDSNIMVINNIGSEDKIPHCYINVTDNSTPQALTQSVWTKLSFINSASYSCNFKIEDNRITYLPEYSRDLMMWGSGTLQTTTQPAVIRLIVVKNNYPQLYGIVSITADTNSKDFTWSANAYIPDVNKNDFFEIWAYVVGSNETILFKEFNWLVKSN